MVIEVLIKQYFSCNQREKKRMSHKRKPKYLRLEEEEEEEAILKVV